MRRDGLPWDGSAGGGLDGAELGELELRGGGGAGDGDGGRGLGRAERWMGGRVVGGSRIVCAVEIGAEEVEGQLAVCRVIDAVVRLRIQEGLCVLPERKVSRLSPESAPCKPNVTQAPIIPIPVLSHSPPPAS